MASKKDPVAKVMAEFDPNPIRARIKSTDASIAAVTPPSPTPRPKKQPKATPTPKPPVISDEAAEKLMAEINEQDLQRKRDRRSKMTFIPDPPEEEINRRKKARQLKLDRAKAKKK